MRAFDFAAREHWAILTEVDEDGSVRAPHLKRILDIASRANEPDFEAVAQKMADRTNESGVLEIRGSIAVVNVTGPIFRYANLFTWISGATSVQEMATAFRAAVDDPKVQAIVLNIDSPGGEVAGISELARSIYEARDQKKIVAYADDLSASGAYWLASAASKIVASDTAELGSIGVVATIVDRGPRDGVKAYQFVSSVSPKKRPDLQTEDGRATVQQRIDDLAGVFVGAVARNRGVAEAKVLSDFGQGGVLIASKAIAAGMADEIGTFEGLISRLEEELKQKSSLGPFNFGGTAANHQKGELPMENPAAAEQKPAQPVTQQPVIDTAAVRAEAIKAERERISGILGCDEAAGREQLARTIALETDASAESAKKLLAAAPKAQATAPVDPLAAAMAGVKNPKVGADAPADAESDKDANAAIRRILVLGGDLKEGK